MDLVSVKGTDFLSHTDGPQGKEKGVGNTGRVKLVPYLALTLSLSNSQLQAWSSRA